MIKYSVEKLYHFRCNCDQWWSIANFSGELDDGMHCPRCGEWQLLESEQSREER